LQAELTQTGAQAVFVETDHTRSEECDRFVETAVQTFGHIDILFNNAGIVTRGTAETTSEEDWMQTMALNVTAVWRMCRLVIPELRKAGGGVIVNNASDWAVVGGKGALPYATSKGAVALMTKSMALDRAHEHIRINAVCPGDTFVERWLERGYFEHTDPVSLEQAMQESASYLPMKRFGYPEEIARAVLFLASEDSSFVTGHLLLVDGGNTAQ
jgi:NAD(P)-dependent dehydrogenase (short-subunit alcohol dehydrogenase family)